jgi:hypothetical protein
MSNPPRIWLDYRPVRIGWVVDDPSLAALAAAAHFNSCLWGGRFNPIIPCRDAQLAAALIKVFNVDVLLPVQPTEKTAALLGRWPHLDVNIRGDSIFRDRHCAFVDIQHAVKRAQRAPEFARDRFIRPTWTNSDPLAPLLSLTFGSYPDPGVIAIDYARGIRSLLEFPDHVIGATDQLAPKLLESVTPLLFTGFDLTVQRDRSGWLAPGIVLGDFASFHDLLLFWNLRAAGAQLCFYDRAYWHRLGPFLGAFLAALRRRPAEASNRVNLWSRAPDWPPPQEWTIDLDVTDLRPNFCRGEVADIWDSYNIRPVRPKFSAWHRDVISSYNETEDRATAAFALPDRPCDDDDPLALDQRYIVTVDAKQYGAGLDDQTFVTPFVPKLNEFYGRNFYGGYDHARAEPGSFGRGAIGIISTVGKQQLAISAIRIHDWVKAFFGLFGIEVERSEPGRRCSRLIRQMGGLQGCRVFKVRGARDLISQYSPDQNFTRGAAETKIGNKDPHTGRIRFTEYEDLYIQARARGRLTPAEVFQYLTGRGVFRAGLELTCPNCELPSWIQLDDIATLSTCLYCGCRFDVTGQLKDRDWRYRRSGIFGRYDNQLGGIPVALTLQQLDIALDDSLLMYTTALNFRSSGAAIEPCEADFIGVVAGAEGINEAPVQILFGEAKAHGAFDAADLRKLGRLADAVPPDLADAFIMFAKTDAFTNDEIGLAQTLNDQYRRRVILWSREELEPYHVYERSEAQLGQRQYATTLTDMASVTDLLWFQQAARPPSETS